MKKTNKVNWKDLYEFIKDKKFCKEFTIKLYGSRIWGKREARLLHPEWYEKELKELENENHKR